MCPTLHGARAADCDRNAGLCPKGAYIIMVTVREEVIVL